MNKSTISLSNNQEKNKRYSYIIQWMQGTLTESIDSSPLFIGCKFTNNRRLVLTALIRYFSIYDDVYVSHERIAQLSGCHHDTVLNALHLFARLGIITIENRGVHMTCRYKLGSFFHQSFVQWELKAILPNIYWCIQSIVRRCKLTITALLSPLIMRRKYAKKPVTALLLNNKNKEDYIKREIDRKSTKMEQFREDPHAQQQITDQRNRFQEDLMSMLTIKGII